MGANLFGVGNQALGTAGSASSAGLNWAQQQAELQMKAQQALGGGLFNLLTLPLNALTGGLGGSAFSLGKSLGGLFGGGGGGADPGFYGG